MRIPVLAACAALLLACHPLDADDTDAAVRARIAERLPGVTADAVRPSPVAGLYEVTVGPRVVYVSADARFVVQGSVLDLDTQTNVTEPRRADARVTWIAGIDESRMIVFGPRGPARHTITVFTDVDCAYCRTMHGEIDELMRSGVRVRYLLYPRDGPGTPSAARADHVWCSADRRDALTRAKKGERVSAPPCETPVSENLLLGRELPVSGTPTLITEHGDVIPGYIPAAQLVDELNRLRERRNAPAARAVESR